MTSKERVYAALRHEPPDKVPYYIGMTVPARDKMADYYGDPDFYSKLGNDLIKVHVLKVEWGVRGQDGYYTDEYGLRWNRTVDRDIGIPEGTLNRDNFDDHPWPDPKDPGRFDQLIETVKKEKDKFIVMTLSFSFFERSWGMVGQDKFLMAMIQDKPFVEAVLDKVMEFNLAVIDEGIKQCPDIDAVYFGDDYGTQRGVIMGAPLWRELIKPRLAKQYGRVHDYGKHVLIHSCGAVSELFDDLVGIGLDCFNPFQPEVMDIFETKKAYKNRLSFFGGISVQRLLPHGTPAETKDMVSRIVKEIGKDGGYIAAPSHDIPPDAKAENMAAMIEVLKNQ